MVWGLQNEKLISVEDYCMIFKLHGKKRYSAKRMKDEGESPWLSFKKACTQVVSTACLFEILVSHYLYTVLLEKGVSNKGIPKAY
ncbi:hypothetical protein A5N16_23085 [Arthrobacter sp. M6]|nr:hypothetical protein [Arthrobacter sp. M6]